MLLWNPEIARREIVYALPVVSERRPRSANDVLVDVLVDISTQSEKVSQSVPGLPWDMGLSPSPLNRNPNKFQGVPASLCWKGFGGFGMLKESLLFPLYVISVLVDVLVDYRRCVGG